MNNWFYKGEEAGEIQIVKDIKDFPEGCVGFVYILHNVDNGKYYIGKKSLYHTQRKTLGKKERLAMLEEITGKGRRPTKKTIVKESDWQTYHGSSQNVKIEIIKIGHEKFTREILRFCYNKKQMTYWEAHYQFSRNVLVDENSYNDNILEKFFRVDQLG